MRVRGPVADAVRHRPVRTDRMIDHRLRILQMVAGHGTVTAAAQALHYTPSAVSYQLRQLAAEVGTELVVHQGRGIRLTNAAHVLLRHAERLQEQWELARARTGLPRHRARGPGHAVRLLHRGQPAAAARRRAARATAIRI